tara:strand:- start:3410 stop:3943 length:534 start_codon:yes stop_codon:yes gene_type:complete
MNKSKSSPCFGVDLQHHMRKSASEGDLSQNDFYFEEFFEGDGPLGIVFGQNEDDSLYIQKIIPNTVASETYGIQIGMKLVEVSDLEIDSMSANRIERYITKEWSQNNRIYMKFKKKIYTEIVSFLNRSDLFHYYDKFVELGAYSLQDLEYIEKEDLIKMNMNTEEISRYYSFSSFSS